ncbi:MAG: FtsW/RodA/SpoVE family cell cycle protein [Candidatus Limivivens sp.]|nr:FtsW/RodA/SpoVE family cell cycle protein [Candidatus Limivivens sp.]
MIIDISRYVLLGLILIYSLQSFLVFRRQEEDAREFLFLRQNVVMFCIHFVAFMVLYLRMAEPMLLFFYGAQVIYLASTLVFYRNLYPRASKLLVNNMCMLITIGFIMITRLSYDESIRQFKILVAGTVISLLVPVMIQKLRILSKLSWLYAAVGIGLLAAVAVLAQTTGGAKLLLTFGPISLQPSEFVKISFVFCIAAMLSRSTSFSNVVVTTIIAAVHVLILVISTDLGSALIFFCSYLVVLYVATRDWRYLAAGGAAGGGAAVAAYALFAHVKIRVAVWKDPFADYSGSGYQIAQALFAIGAGGWLGTGLCQGSPGQIPVVEDFMFAAISEELGSLFSLCMILIYMSCFIMFINVALKMREMFYRLTALGLGCIFAVQVFLTIGGSMKMIPMTGVTLPFISPGGSSLLSAMLMFAIVQGMYISRKDEEYDEEKEEAYRRSYSQ